MSLNKWHTVHYTQVHTKSYVPIAFCIYIFLFKTNLSAWVKSKFSHPEVVIFPAVENLSFAVCMEEKDVCLRTTMVKEWCLYSFSNQHIIT
jgi:hypothetical protein